MGKISLFSKEQKLIFDQVKKSPFLCSNFYFTGGTALSCFYLKHRYSQDVDFFSEKKFDKETILSEVKNWAKQYKFVFRSQWQEVVYIFTFNFPNQAALKVDFGYYPYKRIAKGISYEGLTIDSLLDIGVNKLASVNQRSQVKDFVDLYFLLQKFTIWDLIEEVRVKFRMELEPWLLAGNLLYDVEEFTYLPQMIKPIKLPTLKQFFRKMAIELGRKAVEPRG